MTSHAAPASGVVNLLSVDVEDYFQVSAFERVVARSEWDRCESRVRRNTERLLRLFDAAGARGTFFVLGWVAERDPALVRDIVAGGHELASHGYAHRLVYSQTPAEFREDIRRARAVLEAASGQPVMGYRAPSYSITRQSWWALDVLIEDGYAYDASIYPIYHDRYGVADAPRHPHWIAGSVGRILEVPGSTLRLGSINVPFGGGGYFRQFPYPWTRWALRHLNRSEGRPGVFYIHPWEIDPDQPRLPAGPATRFRHYHNLDKAEERLRRMLSEFQFGPVSTLLAHVPTAPSTGMAHLAPSHVVGR